MKQPYISARSTLRVALAALDALSGGILTLLALDADGRLAGTLTDGDVRRALLGGLSLDSRVEEAMRRSFRSLHADRPDPLALAEYRRQGLRLIPVLDAEGRPVRLIDTATAATALPLSAVVMAGGRGERLRPLTLTTPKPLLPVGGKPIIDHNMALLAAAGVSPVTVTVNYLAEQLEEHFAGEVCGMHVKTVREPYAMGTIGSVALTDIPDEGDTLVMNSDLLTTISLEEMWLTHRREHAAITVATIPYTVAVPYAILSTEGRHVKALQEKPCFTYQANAGIYIMENSLLHSLPRSGRTDAPDLLEQAIARGLTVAYYPIEGTWIDIGSPADYSRACALFAEQSEARGS